MPNESKSPKSSPKPNQRTRLRRANSVTLATTNREEKKHRVYQSDRP